MKPKKPVLPAWKVRLRADLGLQRKPPIERNKHLGFRKPPSLPRLKCLGRKDQ